MRDSYEKNSRGSLTLIGKRGYRKCAADQDYIQLIVLLNVCRKMVGRCRLGTKDEACGGKGVVCLCLYYALELVSHGASGASNRRADSQIINLGFFQSCFASLFWVQ